MRKFRVVAFALCAAVSAVQGQTIAGAVLAKKEPHHHLAFEDSTLVVLRVEVPPRDTTLLHEHEPDYFWIALGRSEVVNARMGSAPATIASDDGSVHYTVGKFAHVARNPGTTPFRNITVELLGKQSNPRNLCEEAVAGQPLLCPSARKPRDMGVTERPAFETDQLQVSVLTFGRDGRLAGTETDGGRWYILLNPLDATAMNAVRDENAGAAPMRRNEWRGGTWRPPAGRKWRISNGTGREVDVLEVTAKRR
jgi:hypothetical protein